MRGEVVQLMFMNSNVVSQLRCNYHVYLEYLNYLLVEEKPLTLSNRMKKI